MSTSTNASDTNERFQAELMHAKLEELEGRLRDVEQKHREITELIGALTDLETVKPGTESLISVAPGIFAKGTVTDASRLFVNVGMGIFVKETPEQVREWLQGQLASMEQAEGQMRREVDATLREFDTFKERFK